MDCRVILDAQGTDQRTPIYSAPHRLRIIQCHTDGSLRELESRMRRHVGGLTKQRRQRAQRQRQCGGQILFKHMVTRRAGGYIYGSWTGERAACSVQLQAVATAHRRRPSMPDYFEKVFITSYAHIWLCDWACKGRSEKNVIDRNREGSSKSGSASPMIRVVYSDVKACAPRLSKVHAFVSVAWST
jgi:hypothetical protein